MHINLTMLHPQHLFLLLLFYTTATKVAAVSRPSPVNANLISGVTGGEVAIRETAHTHDMLVGKQRIDFVKHILIDRLKYVQNGKRMADFKNWIRKQGGDVAVKSFHGVEVDWEPASTSENQKEDEEQRKARQYVYDENHKSLQIFTKNDPFSADRLDLDLPANNNLPSLYEGVPIHLTDNLEPSLLQLFWRTIQLSVKFSPVLSTTFLAVVSSKFRRVWYKWVAASLGKSKN